MRRPSATSLRAKHHAADAANGGPRKLDKFWPLCCKRVDILITLTEGQRQHERDFVLRTTISWWFLERMRDIWTEPAGETNKPKSLNSCRGALNSFLKTRGVSFSRDSYNFYQNQSILYILYPISSKAFQWHSFSDNACKQKNAAVKSAWVRRLLCDVVEKVLIKLRRQMIPRRGVVTVRISPVNENRDEL